MKKTVFMVWVALVAGRKGVGGYLEVWNDLVPA